MIDPLTSALEMQPCAIGGFCSVRFCFPSPRQDWPLPPGDLDAIIASFVSRQFPDATSHPWIFNDTQWDGDEMVVDVDAVVVEKQRPSIENHYLLLIVKGERAAAQRIPLENGPDCQSEEM